MKRRLRPGAAPAARAESVARAEAVAAGWTLRDVVRAWHARADFARHGLWAKRAAALAAGIVGPEHEAVITSGPPHMVHEAGRRLARRARLPFVMDMRDPWSLHQRVSEYLGSPLYFHLARKYERRAMEAASLVLANTERAARALRGAHPALADRVLTVMNGVDEEVVPAPVHGRRFVIAYAGSIYIDRDPRPVLRAAARVVRELSLAPEDFGLEFIGHVAQHDGETLADMARSAGVEGYVLGRPTCPRREVLQHLAGARMLVLLPQDSDMAIPAKLFEYMLFDAWVLALAYPQSAIALALAGSEADVVAPDAEAAIAEAIRRRYLDHVRGTRPRPLAADGRFGRRAQADLLFDRLAEIVRDRAQPARGSHHG